MLPPKQKMAFSPIYNETSKVLILGSFPSVKSREISFYYGNKQNRFWNMLCGYFDHAIPQDNAKKQTFLLKNGIALWDIVAACEIEGSADSNIKNVEIADLTKIFQTANIQLILLNGTLAFQLFETRYKGIDIQYDKMPSTSPANPRYDQQSWWSALNAVFQLR